MKEQEVTPYYLCDEETFAKNITDMKSEARKNYGNYKIGYSFKTNYTDCFIRAVKRLGEYAEVVSVKEYEMAKANGFSDSEIIYNGLLPDYQNKYAVANNGGIVNFDNLDELSEFERMLPHKVNVGLRLNFDIGNGFVSRFGIDTESDKFANFLSSEHPMLNINALHCHISYARAAEFFKTRAEKMAEFAKRLNVKIVDLGGNMYGRMEADFAKQFDCIIPTFAEYAKAIGETFKKHFPNEDVLLISEGGTPFVSNAMHLVASVISIKTIGDKTFVALDVKKEDVGASCATKNPHIEIIERRGIQQNVSHACLVGCSCVETDVLHRDFSGQIGIGDVVMIKNIGAYSVNNDCNFIQNIPKIVQK